MVDKEAMDKIKWWHRITLPDGTVTPGMVRHGPDGGEWPTTRFGLPSTMEGLRVLDVGAWDGFFSFEAERRGAALVVATDAPQAVGGNWGGTAGFEFARAALGSGVEWRKLDITSRDDRLNLLYEFGQFDLVMCFGVLYHIEHAWQVNGALENLDALAKPDGGLLIETAGSTDRTQALVMRYDQGADNDPTNFWYPNPAYIAGHLPRPVEMVYDMGLRFTVRAGGTLKQY